MDRLRLLGGTLAHSTLSPADEQELSDAFQQAQAEPADLAPG